MGSKKNIPTLDVNTFNLNYSSLIEASAGTGKTYTISYLVVRLLLGSLNETSVKKEAKVINGGEPIDIENILVVTFTNAAAADLRARILEKIHSVRLCFEKIHKDILKIEDINEDALRILSKSYLKDGADKNRVSAYIRLLKRAEHTIDEAAICTIHSFCNKALNQIYAFESGRAFNVNLLQDTDLYHDRSINSLQRELFYSEKEDSEHYAFSKLLLETLREKSVADIVKEYSIPVNSVKEIDDKDGYFGYEINQKSLISYNEKIGVNTKDPKSKIAQILSWYEKKKDSVFLEAKILVDCLLDEYRSVLENEESIKLFLVDRNFFAENKEKLKPNKSTVAMFELLEQALKGYDIKDFAKELINKLPEENKYFNAKSCAAVVFREDILNSINSLVEIIKKLDKLTESVTGELSVLITIMYFKKIKSYCLSDNVISNDELLIQLANALTCDAKRSELLAQQIRSRYKVAMIDEFQDTDPVQFEIFNKLYLSDSAKESGSVCYLIGDPKQSIYAFRGSDIHSYNKAKQIIQKNILPNGKSAVYTLNKNYRSSRNVIEGVNCIFSNIENENHEIIYNPFDFDKTSEINKSGIEFSSVLCPNEHGLNGTKNFYFEDERPIHAEEKESQSNYFIEFNESFSGKEKFQASIAKAVAYDVKRCLCTGYIYEKKEYRKVKPSDIAILVSCGEENDAVQKALNALGIKSVYFSDQSSVLNKKVKNNYFSKDTDPVISEEAQNILYFMEAMTDSSNASKVNKLLGSGLLCKSYEEYLKATDSEQFDEEISLLRDCYECWCKTGFLSAFSHYISAHELISLIMKKSDGERVLSNYFQIAELIQNVSSSVVGANAQMLWLTEQIYNDKDSDLSKDEKKKRLESEQDLVKIYTIHKSKGLQYPLVFLPFLYITKDNTNKKGPLCYYDDNTQKKTLSLSENILISDSKTAKDLYLQSENQEKVRLLYVALTRAQSANFIYSAKQITIKGKAALRAVMENSGESKQDLYKSEYFRELKLPGKDKDSTLDYSSDAFASGDPYTFFEGKKMWSDASADKETKVNEIEPGSVHSSFTITSYSGLTSGAHGAKLKVVDEASLEDEGSENQLANTEYVSPMNGREFRFSFTKGSKAGDLLHKLLELLVSDDSVDKDSKDSILQFVYDNKKYDLFNLMDRSSLEEDGVISMANWLYEIIHAPIIEQDISLSDLTSQDCACELEFFMPCEQFSMNKFNEICSSFAKEKLGNIDLDDLSKSDFDGYMKGSIDLLARFTKNECGKYYLIDYKSNHLGSTYQSYSQKELLNRYFESRYDVQTLIYSLAVHRFLLNSDASYDGSENAYDSLVGGAMYLYVRGLSSITTDENISYGVLNIKVPYETVMKLDKLFKGEK
ncbi:MAG: UvrD-helicase domain-containing protein [Succinatimonas hippei]|nr:UvrD-helicase domain-containing protein [Succinatimonas hippei]